MSAAVAGRRTTNPPKPAPAPPDSRVAVTTCDRHRWFVLRFVWAGIGMAILLAGLWAWAVVVVRREVGTENVDLATVLLTTALLTSIGGPIALSLWYCLAGPVIVDRVTPEAVILDRVRPAYFAATGLKPNE